jgi:hypothetical protein
MALVGCTSTTRIWMDGSRLRRYLDRRRNEKRVDEWTGERPGAFFGFMAGSGYWFTDLCRGLKSALKFG